jgi:hypothetical protein
MLENVDLYGFININNIKYIIDYIEYLCDNINNIYHNFNFIYYYFCGFLRSLL